MMQKYILILLISMLGYGLSLWNATWHLPEFLLKTSDHLEETILPPSEYLWCRRDIGHRICDTAVVLGHGRNGY